MKIDKNEFANFMLDRADIRTLERCYYEDQFAYIESMHEDDLIEYARNMGFTTNEGDDDGN